MTNQNITAIILGPATVDGFYWVAANHRADQKRYSLHASVLGACGFATTQAKQNASIEFEAVDADDSRPYARIVRICKIGEVDASVSDSELTTALENEPVRKPKKVQAKKKPTQKKRPPAKRDKRPAPQRAPKIVGKRPVQVEVQVGDYVLGVFKNFDWENVGLNGKPNPFGFVEVTHVNDGGDDYRPLESHERVKNIHVSGHKIPQDPEIEDAMNGGLFLLQILHVDGKNPSAKIISLADDAEDAPKESGDVVEFASQRTGSDAAAS